MVYISRSRSRSVSTAPFTRATGLSLTCKGEVWAEAVPVRSVGVCEASCADAAESASARNPLMGSWYFIKSSLSCCSLTLYPARIKKGRVDPLPFLHINSGLLEDRRDVVGVVGFVRLAKVALAAELRGRRSIGVGHVVDVRVIGAVDEEEGGVVLAAAVARDRARRARCVNRHHVLVVAGGAEHVRSICGRKTIRVRPFPWRQCWPAVVGYELSIGAAGGNGQCASGVHQAAASADESQLAHGVIVGVIAA